MKTLKTFLILIGIIALSLSFHIYHWVQHSKGMYSRNDSKVQTGALSLKEVDRTLGCDISHWDGEIDWLDLRKKKIEFVFIKATQGSEDVDPNFEHNWLTSKNFGFIRGAYHFYDPKDDPKAQANHFLTTVKHEKGDILPVLDIEVSHGVNPDSLTKGITVWIETVKDSIGRYPIIYTDDGFWNKTITQNFEYCPLWIAEWEKKDLPTLPKGWKDWAFWQFTNAGTLPGIAGKNNVDLSHFNGDLSTLKNYQIQ